MSLKMKMKLGLLGGLMALAVSLFVSGNAMPDSADLFRLKRLQEKVFMKMKINSEDKVEYYSFLLNKRLNELKYLVEERQYAYILSSSLRYSTTAGLMTEVITANDMDNVIVPTIKMFKEHQLVFSQLVETYPFKDSGEWKFLQDDYNYLEIYLGFLSEIE